MDFSWVLVLEESKPIVSAVSMPSVSQSSFEFSEEDSPPLLRPLSLLLLREKVFSHELDRDFSFVLERSRPCVKMFSMPLVWVRELEPPTDFETDDSLDVVSAMLSSLDTVSVAVSSWLRVFVSENSFEFVWETPDDFSWFFWRELVTC